MVPMGDIPNYVGVGTTGAVMVVKGLKKTIKSE